MEHHVHAPAASHLHSAGIPDSSARTLRSAPTPLYVTRGQIRTTRGDGQPLAGYEDVTLLT